VGFVDLVNELVFSIGLQMFQRRALGTRTVL
jgi:hypothetical protein